MDESALTVVVAGLVNLAIAIAKIFGALISGSAAMLSEAAHSLADTVTEVLLLVAVRRGAKPADRRHPFGYGREFYLWALLASVATFAAGGGVSIVEGVQKILNGTHDGSPVVAFVVLAVAFVLEAVSFRRALTQVRAAARRWRVHPSTYLRNTSDTAVKAVTFEDGAALIGLVLAAVGLGLTELTGNPVWDGGASVAIGVLLVAVSVALGRANSRLLIGQSVPPALTDALRRELDGVPGVVAVSTLVATLLGPEQVLVAARVQFAPGCSADDVAVAADEAERRFRVHHPEVREVFLDPTPRAAAQPIPHD